MRSKDKKQPPSGKGSAMGVTCDADGKTLSSMSRDGVDKLVRRANARQKTKKLDDLGQCIAMPESGPKRNGKQVLDVRVTWNDVDSRSAIQNDGLIGSTKGDGGSFQTNASHIDDGMDGIDWEDGSTPLSGFASNKVGDSIGKVTIEFDGSPDSTQVNSIRRATAEDKELAELVHKVHLLCLLARGRVIDSACDDPLIQASLLSLLPTHLWKISEMSKLTASALSPLVLWFHNYFHVSSSDSARRPFSSALAFALENQEGTPEVIAALSVALFRALRLTTRFVSILDVVSKKPEAERGETSGQEINTVRRNIFQTSTLMVDRTKEAFACQKNVCKTSSNISIKSNDGHSSIVESQSGTSAAAVKLEDRILELPEITNVMSEECISSACQGAKRKGDLEFEMQLQMALSATSATAAAAPQSIGEPVIENSSQSLQTIYSPNKKPRRIRGEESSSQGLSTAVGSQKTGSPLYWAEVYCSREKLAGKWVHVDAVNAIVDGEERVEAAAAACKTSLRYVVAFAGSGAKDVTRRYCMKWHKIAPQRVNSAWWDSVLAPLRELESGATSGMNADVGTSGMNSSSATRSSLEDMELETRALTEPLPTNQQAYKNHQLYAIERWLTKSQILRPKGPVLGFCSGHPVYPRSCVQMLKTKERWLREGLQVKANEHPAKVLKQSGKQKKVHSSDEDDGETDSRGTTELYGKWQLEPLQLPHAINGIVPKNERGQVDVWSEKCLPPGTVHIPLPRVFHVAKRLEIDYAPAMVGFEFKGGRSVPVFDGIVVCTEFKDVILEAYAEEEERREAEEKKRNEAQAISRWYQLLSSIITRQRLNNSYGKTSLLETPNNISISGNNQNADVNRRDVMPLEGRKKLQSSKLNSPLEDHEHLFLVEDETFDEASAVRTKRCCCGFSVQVEEL